MRWRQPADPALAQTIVASFGRPAEQTRRSLANFPAAAWRKTWFWLDASGLALYFLSLAEQASFAEAIDFATLERLRRTRDHNQDRTAGLLEEFITLNNAFLADRILFANLKGFTLVPDSCPSPELRLQLDFDFLVARNNLPACQRILEKRGYRISGTTNSTWEFKAEEQAEARSSNPYQRSRFRSVELHFSPAADNSRNMEDGRLQHLCLWHYKGHSFPALTPHYQMSGQVLHILAHLRSAVTRPQWLLEFSNHAKVRAHDERFWREVSRIGRSEPLAALALAVSVNITRQIFGPQSLPSAVDWAEQALPPTIRLWIERYGSRAVMADFPGTKLYLLLEHELALCSFAQPNTRSLSAMPEFRVPKLFYPNPTKATRERLLRSWTQLRYVLFRLRFHSIEGLRHHVELRRWTALRSTFVNNSERNLPLFRQADKRKTSQ